MPVIATIALEHRNSLLGKHRQFLTNLELNNSCANTGICGSNCYLNVIAPATDRTPLDPETVLEAAIELIRHGRNVRHMACPGKEPWESSTLLLEIIEEFHGSPIDTRPGTIGIISASPVGFNRHAKRLSDTPLSWAAISLDTPDSGLRNVLNNAPLLSSALRFKEAGATELLGVNTVLTETNLSQVLRMGKQLQGIGVDQWALGPLLRAAVNGRMESAISIGRLREIIDRVCQEFAGEDLQIVFDLDLAQLRGLVDEVDVFVEGANRWRFEYEMPGAKNILVEAGNPNRFFRMDWSGKLSSKEDYRWIGRAGSFGEYRPGRIAQLLGELETVGTLVT